MMSWGSEFKENQKILQKILYIFLHEVLLSDLSVQTLDSFRRVLRLIRSFTSRKFTTLSLEINHNTEQISLKISRDIPVYVINNRFKKTPPLFCWDVREENETLNREK